MEPIVIYIADNQYLTYLGLSSIFRSFYGPDVIIENITSNEILEYKIGKAQPFLIAIDYVNFDFAGVCDLHEIRKMAPLANILVVSDNKDSRQIKEVLKSGITHYIFKTGTEDDFYNALRAIQNKRKYIGSELYDILLQKEKKSSESTENLKLSNSETEIVKLISNGKTTKEIAEIKNLSFHTINTHRKNIFRKLNINNSSELVKYAMNSGIINDIEYYI
jgi:DNA-binding NarL/FixJ family response regulator